jgi:hypothetical protein
MNHFIINLSNLAKFPVNSKLIVSSLLIAINSILVTSASAPAKMPLPRTTAKTAPATTAATQQFVGQWQAKDPESGELVTFVFAPEGKLFIIFPTTDGPPVAIGIKYQVNPTTKPGQLDIVFSKKDSILSIFEFIDRGKLRLELEGRQVGQPRPSAFSPKATVFEKISNSATLPQNVKVIELENAQSQTPEDSQLPKPQTEAKLYIAMVNKAQQAYYQQKGKFATKTEDLGLGGEPASVFYNYRLVSQGKDAQSVMIAAQAKNAEIHSYTGAVFATKSNGKATTFAAVCETQRPSTSPPAMPKPPQSGSSAVQCPSGSRLLQ